MTITYNEEANKFVIDMKEEFFLASKKVEVLYDATTKACDCTPTIEVLIDSANVIAADDITAWNLVFNSRVREAIRRIRGK